MPNSVHLHRVLATRPEKIYRAFVEADALAKWLPPNGFVCTVHHLEPKAGGTFKMSFRNFTTGKSHAFGGEYVELVPNECLRYTDKFDDPNLTGEMLVTVSLKKVSVGTRDRYRAGGSAGRHSARCLLSRLAESRCETWQGWLSQRSINSAAESSQGRRDRGASCLAGS